MDKNPSNICTFLFLQIFCSKEFNNYAIVSINKDKHVVKYGTILDIS